MRFAHGTAQSIRLPRIQDQVHVVWHQAVSPDFHIRLARLLPKKIAVNLLIAVLKENRFAAIATLRYVVRETGYHDSRQTRHEANLPRTKTEGNRYHVDALCRRRIVSLSWVSGCHAPSAQPEPAIQFTTIPPAAQGASGAKNSNISPDLSRKPDRSS
jgi:hypothetical protein